MDEKPSPMADTAAILESISDGVFTVDAEWHVTSFNRAAEEITGIPRADAIGKPCCEVFRASMCEGDCALRRTLDTGAPIVNKPAFIVNAQGSRIPVSVSTAVLRNAGGSVIGGAETFRDLTLVEELRQALDGQFEIGDLVSRSPALRRISEILPQVAASDSTVLIQGETGTGKELLARAIHALGPRGKAPLVAVHCGALPDSLLESELFGYKGGAFTGAVKDKPGRFAAAEGGTLFLDEIGEVSPAMQVRLLRILQERVYEPLGSTSPVRADVRILAATHRNLSAMVADGTFRHDLFYRVNVARLFIPPLRERKEDIPLLTDHFVHRFNRRQGRAVLGISPDAMAALLTHDFPGNVRELENIVEHAFILCGAGLIETAHLPELPRPSASHNPSPPRSSSMACAVHSAETNAILDALRRNHYSRLAAARELGMHKSTLFRKMKALGIAPPELDGRHLRSR